MTKVGIDSISGGKKKQWEAVGASLTRSPKHTLKLQELK